MGIDRYSSREKRRLDMRTGTELLDALSSGRLVLAFQPIRRIDHPGSDACLYSEVLLRRVDGPLVGGTVRSCSGAIGALERMGRIQQLDFSVLRTVIELLEKHPDQRLGCNVSAASLRARALWSPILSYLAARGDLAQRLTLEITETSAIQQGDRELELVADLRVRGTCIAIDDLGAGFTTFEFLARCRPDVVKIDRAVLLRACEADAPAGLLGNLARVCADYSPCIVVEGVENAQELEVVCRSGAQCVQGFLNAPPDVAPAWLDAAPVVVRRRPASGPPIQRVRAAGDDRTNVPSLFERNRGSSTRSNRHG